jgi:hypothetical protein
MFSTLPSMVTVGGVLTLTVVLAWGRFYQTIGELVCEVSTSLEPDTACAPGSIPDLSALLSGEAASGNGPAASECVLALAAGNRDDPSCSQRYVVRLQAQGSNLQKAVTFDQQEPVTAAQALQGLEQLKGRLTRRELAMRDQALLKAAAWIAAAARVGGAEPPGKSGFTNRGVRGRVAGIDVEILRGKNLVPP